MCKIPCSPTSSVGGTDPRRGAASKTATEVHIAKPGGWPTGKYKVEISANGAVVTAKNFVVN